VPHASVTTANRDPVSTTASFQQQREERPSRNFGMANSTSPAATVISLGRCRLR
jgi:hypothetical protein